MNTIAHSRSPLFLVIGWILLLSSFADGANLDDLLPGAVVMHDDEECLASLPSQFSLPFASPYSSHWQVDHPGTRASKQTWPASSQKSFRIFTDQDSPSLAADHISSVDRVVTPASDVQQSVYSHTSTDESLFLQHCTLLI